MAVIVKYGITPTESAKSEVTMRISVKNWCKKVVSRVLGGPVSVTSGTSVMSVTYICRLQTLYRLTQGDHFLRVVFDGESIGDLPRSPF